jgi:hypothetical protein
LVKARRVIARTASLRPWAYVVHLDGRDLAALGLRRWQDRARRSLELVAGWAGDPRLVSIENLEAWDPAAFAPLLDELPVSRCVDVGHLWFQGLDPLPALDAWLPRARVVHLHGVADRDHQSLAHVPDAELARVAAALEAGFDGVATIEVFSAEDLRGSLKAWQAAGGNPAPEGKSKPASAL